jgi:peroxiredoxin
MKSEWHRRTDGRRVPDCDGRRERIAPLAAVAPRLTALPRTVLARKTRCMPYDLVGREIPSVVLSCSGALSLDLGQFAQGFPLVVYTYPAISPVRENAEDTRPTDAAQHLAFRDHQPDLEARGYRLIGISNQSPKLRAAEILESGLSHILLSDPQLRLAQELDVPTITVDGIRRYRRMTLIVSRGLIEKAFFPVVSPARNAAQVVAWMTLHGIS